MAEEGGGSDIEIILEDEVNDEDDEVKIVGGCSNKKVKNAMNDAYWTRCRQMFFPSTGISGVIDNQEANAASIALLFEMNDYLFNDTLFTRMQGAVVSGAAKLTKEELGNKKKRNAYFALTTLHGLGLFPRGFVYLCINLIGTDRDKIRGVLEPFRNIAPTMKGHLVYISKCTNKKVSRNEDLHKMCGEMQELADNHLLPQYPQMFPIMQRNPPAFVTAAIKIREGASKEDLYAEAKEEKAKGRLMSLQYSSFWSDNSRYYGFEPEMEGEKITRAAIEIINAINKRLYHGLLIFNAQNIVPHSTADLREEFIFDPFRHHSIRFLEIMERWAIFPRGFMYPFVRAVIFDESIIGRVLEALKVMVEPIESAMALMLKLAPKNTTNKSTEKDPNVAPIIKNLRKKSCQLIYPRMPSLFRSLRCKSIPDFIGAWLEEKMSLKEIRAWSSDMGVDTDKKGLPIRISICQERRRPGIEGLTNNKKSSRVPQLVKKNEPLKEEKIKIEEPKEIIQSITTDMKTTDMKTTDKMTIMNTLPSTTSNPIKFDMKIDLTSIGVDPVSGSIVGGPQVMDTMGPAPMMGCPFGPGPGPIMGGPLGFGPGPMMGGPFVPPNPMMGGPFCPGPGPMMGNGGLMNGRPPPPLLPTGRPRSLMDIDLGGPIPLGGDIMMNQGMAFGGLPPPQPPVNIHCMPPTGMNVPPPFIDGVLNDEDKRRLDRIARRLVDNVHETEEEEMERRERRLQQWLHENKKKEIDEDRRGRNDRGRNEVKMVDGEATARLLIQTIGRSNDSRRDDDDRRRGEKRRRSRSRSKERFDRRVEELERRKKLEKERTLKEHWSKVKTSSHIMDVSKWENREEWAVNTVWRRPSGHSKWEELAGDSLDIISDKIIRHFNEHTQNATDHERKRIVWDRVQDGIQKLLDEHGVFFLMAGSSSCLFGTRESNLDLVLISPIPHITTDYIRSIFFAQLGLPTVITQRGGKITKQDALLLEFECTMSGETLSVRIAIDASALYFSKIMAVYDGIDKRVSLLVVYIKHWVKDRFRRAQDISKYLLTSLVIHYLQCAVSPPILPCLHSLYPSRLLPDSFASFDFASPFDPPLPECKNVQSIGSLLIGFFMYYSGFEFDRYAISIRKGSVIKKRDIPHDVPDFAIEHPFDGSFTVVVNEPFTSSHFSAAMTAATEDAILKFHV